MVLFNILIIGIYIFTYIKYYIVCASLNGIPLENIFKIFTLFLTF
jgi:hypothetical protein